MNRTPIRRYKRRGGGGATAVIVILSVVVLLAFICLLLALTGRLDPLMESWFGGGSETDPVTETDPEDTDPVTSGPADTDPVTTAPPVTDPPISGSWLTLTAEDAKKGILVLVNNDHPFAFPSQQNPDIADYERLINFYNYRASNGGSGKYQLTGAEVFLSAEASAALHRMLVECVTVNAGTNFFIQQLYRSYEDQDKVYRPGSTGAFKPGCSDYHTGNAVYLKLWLENEDGSGRGGELTENPTVATWIEESAYKYGFVMRYPSDKKQFTGTITDGEGHYRYVGPIHAAAMKERDMCLEEYLTFLAGFTYTGNHLQVTTDQGNYEIYSVKLSEQGPTKVPVPEGDYLISGDGQGSVIIAVPVTE